MPTPRIAIVLAALTAWSIAEPAWAADNSALAFVTAIYNSYKGHDAKGIPLENGQIIRRYFEPQLATLMTKDQTAAAKRGEVGLLDYDPFLEAQDWDTSSFDIAVDDAGVGKAKASVKFINEGEAMTVLLDLLQTKNGWRVYDITWQHDGKSESLRQIYIH